MSVIVYHKPNCKNCEATMGDLDKYGISYEHYDLMDNLHILKKVKELGLRVAPIVSVDTDIMELSKDDIDSSKVWCDYQPDKIKSLLSDNDSVDSNDDDTWVF